MLTTIALSCLLFLCGGSSSHIATYNCKTNNIFQVVASTKGKPSILNIDSWVDLNGKALNLPSNCTLVIKSGGFDNGKLVGNNTTLSAGTYQIFGDKVSLDGKWIVDKAYAEWFGYCGDEDATDYIQKCLNTFFQCKLLNRKYSVKTINLPDNSLLEGSSQGRYQCSTLIQDAEFEGDLITTGDKEYSGITISGIRISGGNQNNTAIRISVPNSVIKDVICDQYAGNGINLKDRAWSTTISHCSVMGNMKTAKNRDPLIGIRINTGGGLVSIDHCDINYYETGILIERGVMIAISGCNISECSENELKKPVACIRVFGGTSIDIYDNYIENFSTGILLFSGKQVNVHNNYLNGLSVASFGVDIKGDIEEIEISNNHIYMGYKGAWAVAIRSNNKKTVRDKIRLVGNDLDNNKLYNATGVAITK